MRVRKALAAGLVVGLLAVLIGAAAPATAAPSWPSGWNPKQFMINVLGSVLSAAGGDNPFKRTVIAADQKFDHSWEGLEQQWKKPGGAGAPQSYDDYVIQKQTYFAQNGLTSVPGDVNHPNSKKYVATAKPPATKATAMKKIAKVGGPLVALTAFEFRADIANGVVGMFGIDTNGAVCSNPVASEGFVNFLTGQDCAPYKLAQEYTPNVDLTPEMINGFCGNITGIDAPPANGAIITDYQPKCRGGISYARPSQGNGQWRKWNAPSVSSATVLPNGAIRFQINLGGEPLALNGWNNFNPSVNYRCIDATGKVVTLAGNGGNGLGRTTTWEVGCAANHRLLVWMTTPLDGQEATPITQTPHVSKYLLIYVQGQPLSELVDPDPQRTLNCTITGDDGNTYTSQSEPYSEAGGLIAPPKCPELPAGVGAVGINLTENGPMGPRELYNQPTTEEYKQWWQQYPECRDGACSLDLVQKTNQRSCFSSVGEAELCRDWFTDPQRDAKYQCTYGVHAVSLTECYVYADVFKPEKVLNGQAYTDPKTGDVVAGQSSPGAASIALRRPIVDPSNFTGCLDTGWAAANPVEWVMVPVQCALQWAFAPRPGVVLAEFAGVENAWAKKPPAVITGTVSEWNITPTMSGCDKTVNFLGAPLQVWNVCPGSPYEWLAITSRLILNISVTVGVVWAIRRLTSSTVNYTDG